MSYFRSYQNCLPLTYKIVWNLKKRKENENTSYLTDKTITSTCTSTVQTIQPRKRGTTILWICLLKLKLHLMLTCLWFSTFLFLAGLWSKTGLWNGDIPSDSTLNGKATALRFILGKITDYNSFKIHMHNAYRLWWALSIVTLVFDLWHFQFQAEMQIYVFGPLLESWWQTSDSYTPWKVDCHFCFWPSTFPFPRSNANCIYSIAGTPSTINDNSPIFYI